MAVVMSGDQRDAMYRYVIADLDGEDIAALLREGKVEAAQELRRRFEQDVWLLDELGWFAARDHERYEIEFSVEDSLAIFGRFRRVAYAVVDESEAGFSDETLIDALYVSQLCDQVFGGSEADATSC